MDLLVLRRLVQEAYSHYLDEYGAYLVFLGSECETELPDLVDCITEYLFDEGVRFCGEGVHIDQQSD